MEAQRFFARYSGTDAAVDPDERNVVAERMDHEISTDLLKIDLEEGGPYHGMSLKDASAVHAGLLKKMSMKQDPPK